MTKPVFLALLAGIGFWVLVLYLIPAPAEKKAKQTIETADERNARIEREKKYAKGWMEADRAQREDIRNAIRIGVFDDTENRPLPRKAEIWMRGVGSWWIAQDNLKTVAARKLDSVEELFVYPDERPEDGSGKELKFTFKITEEMCRDGCVRDMISIAISDHDVTVTGAPIKAANGAFELKLSR